MQVSALRKKRLKSLSNSVTPLLDTPSGAGLGRHIRSLIWEFWRTLSEERRKEEEEEEEEKESQERYGNYLCIML